MVKRVAITLAILCIACIGIAWLFFNKPIPSGEKGLAAEVMAQKMLKALNKPAWDSTNVVRWVFPGDHRYVWDKNLELVEVQWANKRVLLNLGEWEKSIASTDGETQLGDARGKLMGEAYAYFCNDSFWLIAPYKVLDEGVVRKLVVDEKGRESLLVAYSTGGVTPGDCYQWFLDERGFPTHYRMWVSIIPIGGVKATWDSWLTTKTGATLSTNHAIGPLDIEMQDVQTGQRLSDIGITEDIFASIK